MGGNKMDFEIQSSASRKPKELTFEKVIYGYESKSTSVISRILNLEAESFKRSNPDYEFVISKPLVTNNTDGSKTYVLTFRLKQAL